MRTKTLIESPSIPQKDNLQLIHSRCKNDHLSYSKYLPAKKHQSTYNKEYPTTQVEQLIENRKFQQYRQKIAPPTLDTNLLKRSLQRSDSHFSPKHCQKLPSIVSGSIYKNSYNLMQNQSIVKGKEQPSFFLKMGWHDNPQSNYQKSYQQSSRSIDPTQKGKALNDHLVVLKKQFKGQSMYNECYSPLRKKLQKLDSKDCIKNKDHLLGKGYSLHGKSEYKQKYEIKEKQNQSTIKTIPSEKRIKEKKLSLLPEIKKRKYQKQNQNQKAPKKKGFKNSKKTKSNPIVQENIRESTHQRIFGEVVQN